MIDVFIPTTGRRWDLLMRTVHWWSALAGAAPDLVSEDNIHFIDLNGQPRQDQDRWRREQAERNARTSIYVLTDDDIVPELDRTLMASGLTTRRRWMEAAIEIVTRHHEAWGVLGAWLTNEPLEGKPADCLDRCGDLADEGAVGGLRFIVKGAVTEFPPVEHSRGAYDSEHQRLMKAAGYRCGWMRTLPAYHYGKGRSELWHDWPNEKGDR